MRQTHSKYLRNNGPFQNRVLGYQRNHSISFLRCVNMLFGTKMKDVSSLRKTLSKVVFIKKMSCLSFLHFRHWHCSGSYHSQKCMYFYQHIAKVVKNYAQKSNHFLSFSHYTICWWLLFSSKISFLITILS